jgi:hypothetical protein
MLTYPHINPIAISIGPVFGFGPLRVHWYGIMYLIGFVAPGGWRATARQPGSTWTALDIDDLIFYCAIGVIVGGRHRLVHFLRPRRDRRELAERVPHLGRRHVLSRRHDRRVSWRASFLPGSSTRTFADVPIFWRRCRASG